MLEKKQTAQADHSKFFWSLCGIIHSPDYVDTEFFFRCLGQPQLHIQNYAASMHTIHIDLMQKHKSSFADRSLT